MEILYREIEPADARELIQYNSVVGGESEYLSFGANTFNISVEQEERFINRFKRNPKNRMLVALFGDKIVANASVERNRIERFSHNAELSITVLSEYWGRGIGSVLMEMMINFAKESGAKNLLLYVRSDNERAIALYKKFGFEKTGVYKRYFCINNEYFDADFMCLLL